VKYNKYPYFVIHHIIHVKLIEIKIIRHKPGKLLGAGAVSFPKANLFIVTVIGHKCITNNDAYH